MGVGFVKCGGRRDFAGGMGDGGATMRVAPTGLEMGAGIDNGGSRHYPEGCRVSLNRTGEWLCL